MRTQSLRINLGCISQENFPSSWSFFAGGEILFGYSAQKQRLVTDAAIVDPLELSHFCTASVTIEFLATPLTNALPSRLLSLLWLHVQGRVLVLLLFQSAGCHCSPENRQLKCFCQRPWHCLEKGVSLPTQLNSPQVDSNHLKAAIFKTRDFTASESLVKGFLVFGSVLQTFQASFTLKIKIEKQRMEEIIVSGDARNNRDVAEKTGLITFSLSFRISRHFSYGMNRWTKSITT